MGGWREKRAVGFVFVGLLIGLWHSGDATQESDSSSHAIRQIVGDESIVLISDFDAICRWTGWSPATFWDASPDGPSRYDGTRRSPGPTRKLSPSPRRWQLSPSPWARQLSPSPRTRKFSPSPRRWKFPPSPRARKLSPPAKLQAGTPRYGPTPPKSIPLLSFLLDAFSVRNAGNSQAWIRQVTVYSSTSHRHNAPLSQDS